jgi:ADP-ribose pyrophosphatase YjhB (NUDIX family)
MRYCPECAAALSGRLIDGVERKTCPSPACGFVHWDNPVPVVAALVLYGEKIILARNARWPAGRFSLITGYLERDETPENGALREVKEELGLNGVVRGFIGCYSLFSANQIILAMAVTAEGVLHPGGEIVETLLLAQDELGQRPFGDLAITAAIARDWLDQSSRGGVERTPRR